MTALVRVSHVTLRLWLDVGTRVATAGADHPDGGGLMGVKGPHHGVKSKESHENDIVTLLLGSDDKEKVARKLGKIHVLF